MNEDEDAMDEDNDMLLPWNSVLNNELPLFITDFLQDSFLQIVYVSYESKVKDNRKKEQVTG